MLLLLTRLLFLVILAFSAPALAGGAVGAVGAPADPSWEETIEVVSRAVVALRVRGTRDFDTERAGGSTGTGFIIDKKNGIILTNRHMVHTGPVIAEAVFLNHEEVPLEPIYRDPVHDFGFYRFDPSKVRYMDLAELELRPDRARVGVEVRIIGNDSGEKISILGGTLARLDREAPNYGSGNYNDFNTFYLQAASNTSGGSSGSPVVDRSGAVVGLNAGSRTNTASAFYLPLQRVVRAVPYILRGESPPRGTVQATFRYTPFDELRRLGLTEPAEASARREFPGNIGLLVVDSVVPGGPGAAALRPGDILLSVAGRSIGSFVDLARALDDNVGAELPARVERGGRAIDFELSVADLHAITPSTYLEFSRAILHPLSYMQARSHNVPVRGVYLAQAGYAFGNAGVPARAIVLAVDGEPTPDLSALQAALAGRADGQRIRVRYHTLNDPRQEREAVVTVDRTWHAMRMCALDPLTGDWPCVDSAEPPAASAPSPARVSMPSGSSKAARALARSLVSIYFQVPYPTAGLKGTSYHGAGLVIDAERGLVLTDRDTVPVLLGDLEIGFAGQLRVPGRVVYLHPVHNLAVVQYDPAAVDASSIRAARFVDRDVRPGDRVWQIALDVDGGLVDYETRVAQVGSIALGVARTPRFRDTNLEGFSLTDSITSVGGAIADRRGRVVAGWMSFVDPQRDQAGLRALPSTFLTRVVEPIRVGDPVGYRALGVELSSLGVAAARDLGLPEARASDILAVDERDRRVLQVARVWGGTPADQLLRNGDLILTAQGRTVTRMREIEALTSLAAVDLEILRDGAELRITVPTVEPSATGVDEIVQWAGLILHDPHREVAAQAGAVSNGVYGAWVWYGTPAYDASLRPTRHLIEIDGAPIASLAELKALIRDQRHGQAVRVASEALDGRVEVNTLKIDDRFWPAVVFRFEDGRWVRAPLDAPAPRSPPEEQP